MTRTEKARALAERLVAVLTKDELQDLYDAMGDEATAAGPLLAAVGAECVVRWPDEYRGCFIGSKPRAFLDAEEHVRQRLSAGASG